METISDLIEVSFDVGGVIYTQGKQVTEQDTFE